MSFNLLSSVKGESVISVLLVELKGIAKIISMSNKYTKQSFHAHLSSAKQLVPRQLTHLIELELDMSGCRHSVSNSLLIVTLHDKKFSTDN